MQHSPRKIPYVRLKFLGIKPAVKEIIVHFAGQIFSNSLLIFSNQLRSLNFIDYICLWFAFSLKEMILLEIISDKWANGETQHIFEKPL